MATGIVSILFTDLVGSTDFASEAGDAAADELRRVHFADLREAIAATGGTEVKTIGDAVMVSYSGAADAVAGAVAMQRAVERRNRSLDGRRLDMRVGVSAGDASCEDGDWFGTPVVEASRLCAEAVGGQILVSELVRALAGTRAEFELKPVGTRELKGLVAPIGVCEVSWKVARPTTALPLPAFVDIAPAFPFAGRRDAFETLLGAWKETWEGERRAVLVSGEPGIGKTRLVTEIVRHAHDEGTTVLWGRCDEELGAPFEPFTEALRHYVHHAPQERLRAELGPLGGELTRVLPELSARVPGLAAPVASDAEERDTDRQAHGQHRSERDDQDHDGECQPEQFRGRWLELGEQEPAELDPQPVDVGRELTEFLADVGRAGEVDVLGEIDGREGDAACRTATSRDLVLTARRVWALHRDDLVDLRRGGEHRLHLPADLGVADALPCLEHDLT